MATVRQFFTPEMAQFTAATFPQYVRNPGTNFTVTGLAYDSTGVERAYFHTGMADYGSGNITATVYWYADTASSGGVTWETAIAAITPNTDSQDVETKAFATVNTASDTHLGTTGQRVHSVDVTISNLDSLAAGDVMRLRLSRLTSDAGDTMTGDAIVTGVLLAYSDT